MGCFVHASHRDMTAPGREFKDWNFFNSRTSEPAVHLMPMEETEISAHREGKVAGLVLVKDAITAANSASSKVILM